MKEVGERGRQGGRKRGRTDGHRKEEKAERKMGERKGKSQRKTKMGNVLLDPSCWESDMMLTLFKCPEPYTADTRT